ncbi:CoA-acylating methylmalonate-semialdehyde dehydrogenase [Streptomyces noursei]|uniref:CoA-acylating methylmalonate-semialdehyde dehydrogenase n=1 Tax=Streptomyces noursei TaxID=1971 RepID=UPI001964CA09|nr:CoA-acylating methylmalonate-semialdehyde dehydrogenase [Streptomyces noursei]QRX90489.1 CoA-acylating methylmalonate-semialdehyde dehydrogenase [Streptomyces noursei]
MVRERTHEPVRDLTHFVGGTHTPGTSGSYGDVYDPNTGRVQARVPLATRGETEAAIADATEAQRAWGEWNPQRRARVLLRFLQLVEDERDALARPLSGEHGKTLADAHGDIQRGLDVVEFAAGVPHLLKGEFTDNAGTGIDVHSLRVPIGVAAGITPFNFPAMIPLWPAAPALACRNAFILKHSERAPSVPLRIAELFLAAGLPPGALNVVNGGEEAVDTLLTDPRVGALGFVGSTPIAAHVYATAAAHGKRAQCFGGAKNHLIVMPDADLDQAVDALIGAGYGSAGERRMAVSVAVPVGEATAEALVARLAERIGRLRVGRSDDPEADFGPLVGRDAVDRVRSSVDAGVAESVELDVDGRDFVLPGREGGCFAGASLFDRVTPDMRIYQEETFGPVLSVVRAADYEEALRLPGEHAFGNGVALFTRDGDTARDFSRRVNTGMVGVNVPIPVPVAYHTFGGWKRSGFGDLNQHELDAIRFYTRTKTVTSRWPAGRREGASFTIPAMRWAR